jgi:ElaB/YqjD/DUF883 family membrane-anchored ribosome-binding protein
MSSPEGTFSDRVQETAPARREAFESDVDSLPDEATTDEKAAATARPDARAEAQQVIAQTREVAAAATQYVRDNPLRSVGIAVAVGLVAGLFARRSH